MNNKDARVLERINDAIEFCRIRTAEPKSILFGLEKTGAVQVIATAKNVLTDESRVLAGLKQGGQPPKLKRRLAQLAAAFRRPATRVALPWSIQGLWKADLFVGSVETQQWVGTSVKINPAHLEAAPGLRIGIVLIADELLRAYQKLRSQPKAQRDQNKHPETGEKVCGRRRFAIVAWESAHATTPQFPRALNMLSARKQSIWNSPHLRKDSIGTTILNSQ